MHGSCFWFDPVELFICLLSVRLFVCLSACLRLGCFAAIFVAGANAAVLAHAVLIGGVESNYVTSSDVT